MSDDGSSRHLFEYFFSDFLDLSPLSVGVTLLTACMSNDFRLFYVFESG